jgi:hypothetical protein
MRFSSDDSGLSFGDRCQFRKAVETKHVRACHFGVWRCAEFNGLFKDKPARARDLQAVAVKAHPRCVCCWLGYAPESHQVLSSH